MNTAILRSRIVDLAIHGQLVPQDSSEGTAAELLQDISKHRGKAIIPITTDVPFDIPDSWKWVKLGDICSKLSTGPFGTMIHKRDYVIENGVPLINPTNIKNGAIEQIGIKKIGIDKYQELQAYVLKVGDIIVARRGDLRKCAIISQKENGWLAGTGAFFIRTNSVDLSFICLLYTSNYVQESLTDDSIGSTMDNLNQSLLKNLPFPLPPLSEQHRIVSRVEELLKQVDIIEQAQLDIRQTATILRSKILDKAIHGQLVPQDPSEGTASDLLKEIAHQRGIHISPITDDIPFAIPDSWMWVRLPDLCRERITDGTHRSPQNHKEGIFRYVTAKNIEDAGISDKNITYVTPEDHSEIWARCKPVMGDVLLTKDGSIGRATVNNLPEEFSLLSSVALIKPVPELVAWYLAYYLRAPYMQDKMLHGATGTALKRIVLENIKSYPIPLPPLSEQQRIVAKIEELFKQIDFLMQ